MTSVITLEPALQLIRAPNPSAMTEAGTNTYVVGDGPVCIIDPGPDDPAHFNRICDAIRPGVTVVAILVTHAHRDHSLLAPRLAEYLNSPILAFGDASSGRSAIMEELVAAGFTGGGEGIDSSFRPDICLADGAEIDLQSEQIRAIWTPGHMGNHMCFQWRDAIFSGDHIMGWASSIISPPDGDMTAFMHSLDKIEIRKPRILFPGHGAPVRTPATRIHELRTHRLNREREIMEQLTQQASSISELVDKLYLQTPDTLKPAAARNVHAHLIALWQNGLVSSDGLPFTHSTYCRANSN